MRKLVGALVVVATLLWSLPSVSNAMGLLTPKYGLELQLGGGMHFLSDVNDYLPAANFAGITPAEEMMVGMQFGLGMVYRQMPGFGWQFGYNRFVSIVDQKFRITNAPAYPESWAEQTLTGGEFYGLATWYWPWKYFEVSFGLGPAIYTASMDRSIDIAQDGGSHITSGSFSDASGKSLGVAGAFGIELMIREMIGLNLQLGGRYAKIGKIAYEDPNNAGSDIPVYLNSASGSYLPIDYSGIYLKLSLRGYFHPAGDWRTPIR